jgi:hypothetical protein
MDIFEYATRNKVRFPSPVGELTVEQVWDLPLVATNNKPNLDNVARNINNELKAITEDSFVGTYTDPRVPRLEIALGVVKHIISCKQGEAKARDEANAKAQRKALIMCLLEEKEKVELSSKSREELLQELQELQELQ